MKTAEEKAEAFAEAVHNVESEHCAYGGIWKHDAHDACMNVKAV